MYIAKIITAAALGCFALACPAPATAQTCTVSATSLTFGAYDPLSNTARQSTATVTVTCQAVISLLVAYNIKFSPGAGGSFTTRKMVSGANQMNYQLYGNASLSSIWGDGTAGTDIGLGGYLLSVLTPVTRTYTVYGQIPARQNVAAGTYADTVTILLSY